MRLLKKALAVKKVDRYIGGMGVFASRNQWGCQCNCF